MTDNTGMDQAAEPQSIMDRVAAQFGMTDEQETPPEPEVEAEAETEEVPESDDVEVEVEGTRYRVPKGLEKHLMLNADYTQKTQKVAETVRLLEQSQSAMKLAQMERDFHQETHEEAQQLQAVDQWIKSLRSKDYSSMSGDELTKLGLEVSRAKDIRDELERSLKSKRSEFDQKISKAHEDVKAKAREVLEKHGYKPDAFTSVRDYAKSLGFTETAIDSIEMDAKSALVLLKAQAFDNLQASKGAAVKKLDATPVKPGTSRPMPQNVKDKLALRRAFANAKTTQERDAINMKRIEALFS